MNVLPTKDGQHFLDSLTGDGRSLVIDFGGFTTDLLAVNQDGEVDFAHTLCVPLGIHWVSLF